ncbi:nucleoside 2-deoxyribosyltransferase [Thiomonas sp.]
MKRVYIAGPDVFRPDWPDFARHATATAAALGLEAVLPIPAIALTGPGVTEPGTRAQADRVFRGCLAAIATVDGMVANLHPFRGREPDSGTIFELATARAQGLPVIGYVDSAQALEDRFGTPDDDGAIRDEAGYLVERFGLPVNIMPAMGCTEIVVGSVDAALRRCAELTAACPRCQGHGYITEMAQVGTPYPRPMSFPCPVCHPTRLLE